MTYILSHIIRLAALLEAGGFDYAKLRKLLGKASCKCGMENAFSAVRDNRRVFGEKELIYIISGKEPDYHRFRGVSNKLIRLFLQQRLIFDFNGSCPSFLQFILSRNDKSITALAVSQGMITKKNLTAVIEFLSEKHLFVALNALYDMVHECLQ